jgi:hypothetical protein
MAATARPPTADSATTPARARTRAKKAPRELISVKEAIDRYPEQWIAMEISAYDEDKWATHGYLVTHGKSNKRVWRAVTKRLSEDPPPVGVIEVFIGRHMLRTWAEIQQALDRLAESDEELPGLRFR